MKGMKIYYRELPCSPYEYHNEVVLHMEDGQHLYVKRMGSWGYEYNQQLIAVGTSRQVERGEINCPICRGWKVFTPTHEVDMTKVDLGVWMVDYPPYTPIVERS